MCQQQQIRKEDLVFANKIKKFKTYRYQWKQREMCQLRSVFQKGMSVWNQFKNFNFNTAWIVNCEAIFRRNYGLQVCDEIFYWPLAQHSNLEEGFRAKIFANQNEIHSVLFKCRFIGSYLNSLLEQRAQSYPLHQSTVKKRQGRNLLTVQTRYAYFHYKLLLPLGRS